MSFEELYEIEYGKKIEKEDAVYARKWFELGYKEHQKQYEIIEEKILEMNKKLQGVV